MSVLERIAFSLEIVPSEEPGISTRRFRWRLTASNGQDRLSSDAYATRREATREGEIHLERARERGRLTA